MFDVKKQEGKYDFEIPGLSTFAASGDLHGEAKGAANKDVPGAGGKAVVEQALDAARDPVLLLLRQVQVHGQRHNVRDLPQLPASTHTHRTGEHARGSARVVPIVTHRVAQAQTQAYAQTGILMEWCWPIRRLILLSKITVKILNKFFTG